VETFVKLVHFDPARAAQLSGWARSPGEVAAWCSRTEAPVPPEVIAGWGAAPDVTAYGLVDGDEFVAYGELWVDDDESEVELGRLIVAPDRRGRGVGRRLTAALAEAARRVHPAVFLRVRPDNEPALRCYAAAGFRRVSPEDEAAWNEHQPVAYAWMAYYP
jgi:ribosomal protein S18 acetylase RimI-like enzyme